MSAIKVSTTGTPEAAMPTDLRYGVEVDEALIRPESWHAIDLSEVVRSGRTFPGIAARFGHLARINDEPLVAVCDSQPASSLTPEVQELPASAVPEVEAPAAPLRKLSRVVRKPAVVAPEIVEAAQPEVKAHSVAASPRQASPIPTRQGVAWQQMRQGRRSARPTMDRGGLKLAIAMMVMTWVAVVAIGAYVSITPKSGTKIEVR